MVPRTLRMVLSSLPLALCSTLFGQTKQPGVLLHINNEGYYEAPGVNVMMFDDFYPEGHQGGLTIIQCGRRIAANGDLRLEPTPGQWSPVPTVGQRTVDRARGIIAVTLWYPDSSKDRKGFNPILYPDLRFRYTVRTEASGTGVLLTVDLEEPLPREWEGKIGFNLELFPGDYFGEHYFMDGKSAVFPRQANGPMEWDADGNLRIAPLAAGRELIVAPAAFRKQLRIVTRRGDLQLIDGRGLHNNGWFVVRSTIPAGAVRSAVEWLITPTVDEGWRSQPVIQVSQVGYHPKQVKFAVIELDRRTEKYDRVQIVKIGPESEKTVKAVEEPAPWGRFLRYQYVRFDFSDITEEGLYKVCYGESASHPFEIKRDVFSRHVWHPTLEYFLPVQMCHIKVTDRYKVWHGLCHMDDALMAPVDYNHFDGYIQHESTLTRFSPGEHVPGLNAGGWHDAGDYDLRIESQAQTVYGLALAYEFFGDNHDATSIDQDARLVKLLTPDGKSDLLQQIEHGLLSIVGGYESLGRLYRGIISPTLRQYVHLGDAATISDNLIYREHATDPVFGRPLPNDDGWVFTEINPQRELYVAGVLAAAHRVLKQYNAPLSEKCLRIAEELYRSNASAAPAERMNAAAELYLTTSRAEYERVVLDHVDVLAENVIRHSEVLGRVVKKIGRPEFTERIRKAVRETFRGVTERQKENPYGVPYRPHIWGAGWGIQSFGVRQLFLHLGFPDIYSPEYALNALNFVLGCHPGENTASFVSGVGVNSLTVAYGTNRDEWSYIPGGVASGTALIRPDLPELRVWPYLWQQTEYVLGEGTTDFLILAMAADYLLNR